MLASVVVNDTDGLPRSFDRLVECILGDFDAPRALRAVRFFGSLFEHLQGY